MSTFEFCGDDLYFEESGAGKPVVFLHGLLHRNWMQYQLASRASENYRAIILEFSGHGRSSASADPASYSLGRFADEVLGLLDHLGIEKAVVHGTSLGANVILDGMARYPDRLAGVVIEMPVLSGGTGFAMSVFRPLATALYLGAPLIRVTNKVLSPIPRNDPNLAILLDLVPTHPRQAAAVLRGLIQTADETNLSSLGAIEVPALVIGHPNDPLHKWSDAQELTDALPLGRLVKAKSMLELRFSPDRLWPEVESFYSECLSEPVATRSPSAAPGDLA